MIALAHVLTDPWADGITRRALIEVILLGLTGGALGCWLVLYALAYSAESLAHSLFPGLVGAALLGAPLLLGAAGGIAVAALAVAVAGRIPGIGRDTATAVVISTLFGLGVVLALSPATPAGLGGLLFGDLLGVTDGDLALAAGLGALVLVALWRTHDRLLAVGFDRSGAGTLGVSALRVDAGLLALLAVAIVVAVQGLGNLLVVAVLIAPAATARLVARRMTTMILVAAALAALGGLAGVYVSYYASTAAGASVAAVVVGCFAVARAAYPRTA